MRTGRDPAPLSPGATVNPKAGYGAAVAYLQDGTVLVGSANADQAQQPAVPVIGFRADDLGVWKQALTLPPRSLTGAGGHGFGSVMSASGRLRRGGCPCVAVRVVAATRRRHRL